MIAVLMSEKGIIELQLELRFAKLLFGISLSQNIRQKLEQVK